MSGYDYLCPEMDYGEADGFMFEESLFVSKLPQAIFSERSEYLREQLEDLFRRFGENTTFHYLPSLSKVCVVFHRPGEADLAREELDCSEFLANGPIHVESLRLVSAPWTERHLRVPRAGKQFLISPPSSPPVGWEPSEEPPPVQPGLLETALQDLVYTPGEHIELFESDDPTHPTIRLEVAYVGDTQSEPALSVASVRTARP